ncbi:uncharacterized protein [Nicotiana tomentosiformis]|uniref:uncharacterized protein n=1 Tax=Nicotiana tomentosiformis TaxID=4098 RepID=UPI00388C9AD6
MVFYSNPLLFAGVILFLINLVLKWNLEEGDRLYEFNDWFPAHCYWKGDRSFKQTISSFLSRTQTDMLKKGVFGKFFELDEDSHSRKLTHYMLLSQLFYKDKIKMIFKGFGHEVVFTDEDFHTITGLKVKAADYNFIDSRLRDDTTVKVSVDVVVCDEDAVKLAQSYLLEVVLLGKFEGRYMSDRSMKFIDDRELSASYPWGSLCFDELIANLSHVLKNDSV